MCCRPKPRPRAWRYSLGAWPAASRARTSWGTQENMAVEFASSFVGSRVPDGQTLQDRGPLSPARLFRKEKRKETRARGDTVRRQR